MKLSRGTAPFLALLLATATYAVENVKVDGEAKLWYQTGNKSIDSFDMFRQESTVGQAALELGVKADLYSGLKGNVRGIVLDSLGLQDDYIQDISSAGAGYEHGSYYKTQIWISEANLDYKISNTSVIAGRQTLNTPLLFTERWNASYNTFDAVVVINNDIPKTTLVAGYVAQHNGGAHAGNATEIVAFPSTTMHSGEFYGFGSTYNGTRVTDAEKGAYFFGAMVKPIDKLVANLWYYDVNSIHKAYWVDAEYKISNLIFGVQNSGIDRALSSADDAMITAAMVGCTIDKLSVDFAYSTTDEGNAGTATIVNTATGDKSKVYTQSVFQDGAMVGTRDTTAWRVNAGYKFDPVKLSASVQNTKQDSSTSMKEGTEFDLIATANIAKLVDLTGMYIHRDVDMKTARDFQQNAVRLIASVKF